MSNQRVKSVSQKRKFAGNRFTYPKQSENVQTCSELKQNYLKDSSNNNECLNGTLKVTITAKDDMNDAALEVRNFKKCSNTAVAECGVSVDGTSQRRGHSSLKWLCCSIIY
ncbi:hypothetical protein TNCV_1725761 [Trichonephila clavipes]|nr:hypothetical protein TNCV_1725761 [Trichonephila clavipes]